MKSSFVVRGIVVAAMAVAGIGIAAGPATAAVTAPSACVGPQGSGGDIEVGPQGSGGDIEATDPCY